MTNPLLSVYKTDGESKLKDFMLEYVGTFFDKEDVTVEMIAEVLASEFPEFLYAYAEENFIRGYRLGLDDATRTMDGNNDVSAE